MEEEEVSADLRQLTQRSYGRSAPDESRQPVGQVAFTLAMGGVLPRAAARPGLALQAEFRLLNMAPVICSAGTIMRSHFPHCLSALACNLYNTIL